MPMRLLLALSLIVPVSAAQSTLPKYEVRRASGPVVVDGALDDAAWQQTPAVTLQFLWESQTGPKQATRARLLWDAEALYVGFDADDEDITAQYEQRDDPTYRDDAVEIFINPAPQQEVVYYGFEMNARGVLYDYLNYTARRVVRGAAALRVRLSGDHADGAGGAWRSLLLFASKQIIVPTLVVNRANVEEFTRRIDALRGR